MFRVLHLRLKSFRSLSEISILSTRRRRRLQGPCYKTGRHKVDILIVSDLFHILSNSFQLSFTLLVCYRLLLVFSLWSTCLHLHIQLPTNATLLINASENGAFTLYSVVFIPLFLWHSYYNSHKRLPLGLYPVHSPLLWVSLLISFLALNEML